MCVETLESTSSLESFVACRLIPLDKKSGRRPIDVEEVRRKKDGKVVMMLFKNEIKHAEGTLQLIVGQDAGVEAVVRAMHHIFPNKNTKAVFTNRCRKRFQFDQSKGNAS